MATTHFKLITFSKQSTGVDSEVGPTFISATSTPLGEYNFVYKILIRQSIANVILFGHSELREKSEFMLICRQIFANVTPIYLFSATINTKINLFSQKTEQVSAQTKIFMNNGNLSSGVKVV